MFPTYTKVSIDIGLGTGAEKKTPEFETFVKLGLTPPPPGVIET